MAARGPGSSSSRPRRGERHFLPALWASSVDTMTLELELRPASLADAADIANVYLRSFGAALPNVRRPHSDDEVRDWVRHVLVPGGGVWVAQADDLVVGMLALADGWIEQLYVDPEWQRRGIGTLLLSLAKRQAPTGLQLRTFQVNRAAQCFYERHSFQVVERTDGSENEEHEPDARYVWHSPEQ